MTSLSTHILDTAHGCPAANLSLRLSTAAGALLFEGRTGADGRCPALPAVEAPGRYRIDFAVADYFRERGATLPEPPFLEVVPVAFGIAAGDSHYHVPLLVSPFSYSTYRGS